MKGTATGSHYLLTPEAIREQCRYLFTRAEAGDSEHFRLHLNKMPSLADFVLEVWLNDYPDLSAPYHSRWRHFTPGQMARLEAAFANLDAAEKARRQIELAIVSVLLDAGAGMGWRYTDQSGKVYTKSEGLAVASFELFMAGAFANDKKSARVDTNALGQLTAAELARGFQVTETNPLAGFEGRLNLLRRLADTVRQNPAVFGRDLRLGGIFDVLTAGAAQLPKDQRKFAARDLLTIVLKGLGSIWPGRLTLAGLNLGDTWRHEALPSNAPGFGMVPFHKLSQWLTYSLVEPFEAAGFAVTDLSELTGLAEYRNGGLFIDLGVIEPKSSELLQKPLSPGAEPVIEWRAMTVTLLDLTTAELRRRLSLSPSALPLAKVLQGGTWSAGRKAAASRRADGGPPITIISDGTVF